MEAKKDDRESSPDMEIEREPRPIIVRNSTDLQRLKLEKLMKNPEKAVIIPERPKERGVPVVPDFVRNVMGSSAGAGSGEFHVYRHLRRKEYARQKYMKEKGERERLDGEYHAKLEENKRLAEERTAKKRQKRLKRKQNCRKKKKTMSKSSQSENTESSSDSGDDKDEGETDTDNGKLEKTEETKSQEESKSQEKVENVDDEKSQCVSKSEEVENVNDLKD